MQVSQLRLMCDSCERLRNINLSYFSKYSTKTKGAHKTLGFPRNFFNLQVLVKSLLVLAAYISKKIHKIKKYQLGKTFNLEFHEYSG